MLDRVNDAAALLAATRLSGLPVEPLPAAQRPRNEAEAYEIQSAVHKLIARSRYGERAGYKIGCTTKVVQKYLGIHHPCSGGVFYGTLYRSGATLRHEGFRRAGVECEIAVRIGTDLAAGDGPFDAERLSDAVESYMAALELVDDRYVDWRETDRLTLIADDFFAAACVLGEAVPAAEVGDPAELTGVATVNGAEVGRGKGSDIMERPLDALVWLANALAKRGDTLRAGEVVLLGSLTEPQWLEFGDVAAFEVSKLGRVEATLK